MRRAGLQAHPSVTREAPIQSLSLLRDDLILADKTLDRWHCHEDTNRKFSPCPGSPVQPIEMLNSARIDFDNMWPIGPLVQLSGGEAAIHTTDCGPPITPFRFQNSPPIS